MRFLVPLDESELALSIIPAVRRLLGPCLQADARLAGLLATLPGAETPREPAPSAEVHLLTVLHGHGAPRDAKAAAADPSATGELRPEYGLGQPGTGLARQEAVMRLSVIARVHFPEVATQCHVLRSGRIAETIVKAAEELNVDAIAMATHGRSAVGHLLTGSVTDAVIRTSKRPVVVQRPPAMDANTALESAAAGGVKTRPPPPTHRSWCVNARAQPTTLILGSGPLHMETVASYRPAWDAVSGQPDPVAKVHSELFGVPH